MSCTVCLHWLLWIIGQEGPCFTEYFLNIGHLVNLSISPVCDVKISYWHSWWATNWYFSIDIWNVCFIIEECFLWGRLSCKRKRKKNNIYLFLCKLSSDSIFFLERGLFGSNFPVWIASLKSLMAWVVDILASKPAFDLFVSDSVS